MKSDAVIFLVFLLIPLILQTQSKKDPTPITDIGDFHRSDKISLSPIYANGFWDNLQTKQEKISHLENIIQEEMQVRQNQDYTGYERVQSFINLNGISDISGFIEAEKNSSGNVYDSTYNGKYNVPARVISGTSKEGTNLAPRGVLVGEDPLNMNNYYFWDASTGQQVNLSDFDPNGSIYVGSIAQLSQHHTAIPDIIQFSMEDGQQSDIEIMSGYVLRNSPNNSFISLIAPADTTIDRTAYESNPDLLSDDYGVPTVSSIPGEGEDYYFEDSAQNFIEGRIENEIEKSAVDTTYLTQDKKVFKVRVKAKGNQLEKNLIGNKRFPGNTHTFVHNLSTDSAYYNITVDLNTSVEDDTPLEKDFKVYQNYPNPFNPTTTIKYIIPQSTQVKLSIYNSLGEEVKGLLNEFQSPGEYELKFNAEELPSGIYLYQLKSGTNISTRKMILLK